MSTDTAAGSAGTIDDVRREQDGIDLVGLADLLRRKGRIRGNPVAISLLRGDVPASYEGRAVEPCAIVRHAMDDGERVYVDAAHHACLAGAWQAGFVDVPEEIRTGAYLAKGIPGFTEIGAARVKTGANVLPMGLVKAIAAAPLDQVPTDVRVDFLVLVCEPVAAATLAGVRAAVDGTPPRGAAGSSLCGELFAVPWHEDNVILTPGDMGGRMFNKTRPNEMFVIVPLKYAAHYPVLLSATPDVAGLMEAIKPGHAEAQRQRLAERAERHGVTIANAATGDEATAGGPVADVAPEPVTASRAEAVAAPAVEPPVEVDEPGDEQVRVVPDPDVLADAPPTTMPWDDEPLYLLARAPEAIREFAVPTLEDWAQERGFERITMEVMAEQMAEIGMRIEDVVALIEEEDAAGAAT